MDEKIYLAALHKIWINQKKLNFIFKDNQNYKWFFEKINYNSLIFLWFTQKQISYILEKKKGINLNEIKQILENRKVSIITRFDSKYPKNFLNLYSPPFLLYIRWKINNSKKLSFIWSRAITWYWKKIIENFLPTVWKYFEIVSWWALWCDTYSHKIALENNIKTISIIWTWIDIDYPASNYKMYNEIVFRWWAVISVFPIQETWKPYNFPIRNELVASLSKWIVIVEAKEKSGTLITAKIGLDLWKDIFVVPWDIFKLSSTWCNNLIKKWEAKAVFSTNDILEEYNINPLIKNKEKQISFVDNIEKQIYDLLLTEWLNIDQISEKLNQNITVISFKTSILEINNLIKKKQNWNYEII